MAHAAELKTDCSEDRLGANATARQMKEQVEERIAQTQDALETVATQASDELRNVSDKSARFVRENPGVAVAGAVGVGVLIGLALRSRS